VRGYPPTPGQPPPVYPPGQFAAWNRRGSGQPGRAGQRAGQGGQPMGTGPNGGLSAQPGRPAGAASRYYAEDADPAAEPGYPMLAVSDPAADVTSTQTWRAIEEGRSTGIWTAPPGLRDAGPATGASPGLNSRPPASTGPGTRVSTGPSLPVSIAASRLIPEDATRTDEAPAGGRRRLGTRSRGPRRRRPRSVTLAIAAAMLLVLGAAATLIYTVVHTSPKPRLSGESSGRPSPSSSPSPGLGPYGDIASRQTDPQPLTLAALFPPSFTAIGVSMTNVATNLSGDCASAIVGAKLQSAAGAADCTQVARATYVDLPGSLMGTIGVLNLSTGDAAKTAAQSADANDFISQLTAASGPAQKIGQGTGVEEALAKGHYLILVWAEFTNLGTPTAQNTGLIEQFMSLLVTNTVNKDLTTRMLTGNP
jgi:hypothetical protein